MLHPSTSITYIKHTSTQVTGGPYLQLTKQETRSREGSEQYPSHYRKLTAHTETTLLETKRTTTNVLHPSASQSYVKHTPTKVMGGPHLQLTKRETRNREGSKLYPSQHCKPKAHAETTLHESGRTTTDVLHPSASQILLKHTSTQITGGSYPQLTKQETRSRERAERHLCQCCKLTAHTETTLQESGRTTTDM